MTTEAPLRDDLGAIRYAPRRSIRSVLIYGDVIEVDARYQTNDFGVFDHLDSLPAAGPGKRYVFFGDSYAAGVEGRGAGFRHCATPMKSRHTRWA